MNYLLEPFSPENTELMLGVAQSEIGQQLAKQIRYERYCVIPDSVAHYDLPAERQAEVTKQWCEEILDSDVNNLQHNPTTAVIGQWAARYDGLDKATTDRITRALLVHDIKEVRFSKDDEGDLTYDESHAQGIEGFKKEHGELAVMLVEAGFMDQAAAAEVETDMNDGKQSQPETMYGQYVEIAERLGYIHSAGRAMDAAIDVLVNSYGDLVQYDNLIWMAENCYANSLARLVELSTTHPCVEEFLRLRHEKIKTDLELIKASQAAVLALYTAEGNDETHVVEREAKFNNAYDRYQQKAA